MTPALVDKPAPRRRRGTAVRARRREAITLVMPSLIPILVLSVAPLVIALALAFTDARLVRKPDYNFVGLDNFGNLIDNALFWDSLRIGLIWTVGVTVLQLAASMGLALLLDSGLRLQGLTRVLALIPWAMPPVVVAIMWQMIYSANGGPLNAVLGSLGLPDDTNWLGDFSAPLPARLGAGVR